MLSTILISTYSYRFMANGVVRINAAPCFNPPRTPASQFGWVDNKSDNLLPGDGQPGWSSGHGMLELLATEYTVVAAIWKRRL